MKCAGKSGQTTRRTITISNVKPVSLNGLAGTFRRGVATNLHDLGVDGKTIQSIVRHSDVSVAQRCYIKTLPTQTIAAMNALESALCAERALGTPVFGVSDS